MDNGASRLSRLVGGHLDTVSFVMDYVEIRISYSVLRALRDPVVTVADGTFRFPEPGSRDALCELIDSTIVAAEEKGVEGQSSWSIELRNDAGHILTIPLGADGPGVERAHLVPADETGKLRGEHMWIW